MTDRDESRAGFGGRLRELRLSLGYQSAASFARAYRFAPSTILRAERDGFDPAGRLMRLVKSLENAGSGPAVRAVKDAEIRFRNRMYEDHPSRP